MAMDRIPDIDQDRVDYWRQFNHDEAAIEDKDNDLAPEERRDRQDVIVGSMIKRDDDLLVGYAFLLRVIGPGRGPTAVICYYPPWFGDEAMTFDLTPNDIVNDRAPFDDEEDPMPVFIVPEVELRAAAGTEDRKPPKGDHQKKLVKQFLKAQTPEVRKRLKQALRTHVPELAELDVD